MQFKDYVYITCMILFSILAYLLFDGAFTVRTKTIVDYQTYSDISYKVYLHENDEYQGRYQKMNERYLTRLVDNINFDFNYQRVFSKDMSGYYSYDVVSILHGYTDNINDDIWTKEYKIIDNKTSVINQNNVKTIDINDRAIIDYDNIKKDLEKFSEKYNLKLQGYLEVNFVFKENLNFNGIDKVVSDEDNIVAIIPLTYDTFKINIRNDIKDIDNYYDFSTKTNVNYFLVVLAAFSLSLAISFLALVIREIVISTDGLTKYHRELNNILTNYDEKIVKIKKFYNKKKYNLIYVDSFNELLDVYNTVGSPINFREVKKNEESLFIIIDEDTAWIYQLLVKKK